MSGAYSVADYTTALARLRPRGPVWPTDPGSDQMQFFAACAPSFNRFDQALQDLLVDTFPSTAVNYLSDWESSLGLPDPCAGPAPTVAQRQQQVVARLTDSGGQSRQRIISLAAQLGFTVTLTTYSPFRFGQNAFGDGFGGSDWNFVLGVTITANAQGFPSAVLACELGSRVAAEITVVLLNP